MSSRIITVSSARNKTTKRASRPPSKLADNSTKFKCNFCTRKLSTKQFLANHIRDVHSKIFICDYDCKTFNTKDKLRLHIYLHRKYYQLECAVCSKIYKTDQAMRKHLRTHIEQYPCQFCSQSFRYKKLLENHIASLHEKAETVPCNFCTRLFSNTATRDTHQAKIHKDQEFDTQHFRCDVCPMGFEMKEELRLHSFIHFEGEIHTCCECHQIFKKKKMLQIHMKMHENILHECESCNQTFKFRCNLTRHVKEGRCKFTKPSDITAEAAAKLAKSQLLAMTANPTKLNLNLKSFETTNEVHETIKMKPILAQTENRMKSQPKRKKVKKRKPKIIPPKDSSYYSCDLCGFQSVYKSKMLSHIRHHASSKRNKCLECTESFTSQLNLQKHSMKVHGHGVIGTIMYSKDSSPCPFCGQIFSKVRMKYHLMHHQGETFKCNVCSKVFKKQETLQRHHYCHHSTEKRFACTTCGKKFAKESILTQHEMHIHNSVKLYMRCEICLKLMQVKSLQLHMDKMHGEKYSEKPFACSECGKNFRYEKQMTKHIELVHEKAYRGILYPCNECEMTFNRRSDLREHSFTHFSGKVFECECGMKFKQRRLLTFHQKVHQKEIWPCELCSATFHTRGGRRKHMMKMHNQPSHEIIEITTDFNFSAEN